MYGLFRCVYAVGITREWRSGPKPWAEIALFQVPWISNSSIQIGKMGGICATRLWDAPILHSKRSRPRGAEQISVWPGLGISSVSSQDSAIVARVPLRVAHPPPVQLQGFEALQSGLLDNTHWLVGHARST